MSFKYLGSLVFSYCCFALSISFLNLTRSSYISCIIIGKKPNLDLSNNAPFGVIHKFSSFREDRSYSCDNKVSTGLLPKLICLSCNVSGEILYCMIKCGYREFKSKERTQSCCPTCGSLTYAPSYFSDFMPPDFLVGMTTLR